MRRFLLAWMILAAGCASGHVVSHSPPVSSRPTTSPSTRPAIPNTLVWSESLRFSASAWRRAANSRFGPVALVVICHGADVSGQWWMIPDAPLDAMPVEMAIGDLRKKFTGRPIVLVCCNPGGHSLHGLPGVYYVKRNVICPPYVNLPDFMISAWIVDAGDISEFSSNE
jgi:hypothetical protein